MQLYLYDIRDIIGSIYIVKTPDFTFVARLYQSRPRQAVTIMLNFTLLSSSLRNVFSSACKDDGS